MKHKILILVVVVAMALQIVPASANTISDPNYLTLPNPALDNYPGP